jgi:hypothetical protein
MQEWVDSDKQNSPFPKEGLACAQAMTHVPPSLRGGKQCLTPFETPPRRFGRSQLLHAPLAKID